jgi:hypothetical protein
MQILGVNTGDCEGYLLRLKVEEQVDWQMSWTAREGKGHRGGLALQELRGKLI